MSAYNTPRLHSLTRVTLSITNQLAVTMTFCLPIKLATCFINAIAYHCLHSLSTLSPGPKHPLSLTKTSSVHILFLDIQALANTTLYTSSHSLWNESSICHALSTLQESGFMNTWLKALVLGRSTLYTIHDNPGFIHCMVPLCVTKSGRITMYGMFNLG